mmetsp:Transcript_122851/g.342355  ORF Transcript_122851/g.342355 Transcript_122851/m.342355 type:complete len:266 (-) Transcript_122851:1348-2145(-)
MLPGQPQPPPCGSCQRAAHGPSGPLRLVNRRPRWMLGALPRMEGPRAAVRPHQHERPPAAAQVPGPPLPGLASWTVSPAMRHRRLWPQPPRARRNRLPPRRPLLRAPARCSRGLADPGRPHSHCGARRPAKPGAPCCRRPTLAVPRSLPSVWHQPPHRRRVPFPERPWLSHTAMRLEAMPRARGMAKLLPAWNSHRARHRSLLPNSPAPSQWQHLRGLECPLPCTPPPVLRRLRGQLVPRLFARACAPVPRRRPTRWPGSPRAPG